MTFTTKNSNTKHVLDALKSTSKGRLIYDRTWNEDGRTQEIISDVKLQISSIYVSPRKLSNNANDNKHVDVPKRNAKYKVTQYNNESFKALTDACSVNANDTKRYDKSPVKTQNVTEFDIMNYERERIENSKEKSFKYAKEIANHLQKTDESAKKEIKLIEQRYHLEALKKEQKIKDEFESLNDELNETNLNALSNCDSNTNKLKEVESKHNLLVAEREKQKKEMRIGQLINLRGETDNALQRVMAMVYALQNEIKSNDLLEFINCHQQEMINMVQQIDIMLMKGDLNDADILYVEKCTDIAIKIPEIIESKVLIERERQMNLMKEKVMNNHNEEIEMNANVTLTPTHVQSLASTSIISVSSVSSYPQTISETSSESVDSTAFKKFIELRQFSSQFEKSFESFVNDVRFKRYKNDLQLFIRTTVNAISSSSVDHLRDKFNRLFSLFSGKTIEFQEKRINCNAHNEALNFCISYTAKTFVSVGTKQVVSAPKTAFTMAAIIVQLWSRFPNFGKIFLTQLQDKCPYIIPLYPKREKEDTDLTYLSSCGYAIGDDGTAETEESFLKRMGAMIRIYGAIIQSNTPNNPHDMNYAWNWIALVVNLEPRPSITPEILHAFLSVTIHKFYSVYQKQFLKFMKFMQFLYIPMIEKASEKEIKKHSLVKLLTFVNDMNKKLNTKRGPISKAILPDGVVPDYFWQNQFLFSRGVNVAS